jgi:hypothetical protein
MVILTKEETYQRGLPPSAFPSAAQLQVGEHSRIIGDVFKKLSACMYERTDRKHLTILRPSDNVE